LKTCRTPQFVIGGILLCLLFGGACQQNTQLVSAEAEPLNIRRILVVPFADMSAFAGENLDARCPICGRMFVAGKVAPDATRVLTADLTEWLAANTNYEIIFSDQSKLQIASALSQNGRLSADLGTLMQAGRESETDAVLVGYVYRYVERVGDKYSASAPASVAFGVHLIRVPDGRSVWQGHYDETQGTLLENLFQLGTFLRRKGQWITAEEMAREGLDQTLASFPKS
jgi:hypothetical protein